MGKIYAYITIVLGSILTTYIGQINVTFIRYNFFFIVRSCNLEILCPTLAPIKIHAGQVKNST